MHEPANPDLPTTFSGLEPAWIPVPPRRVLRPTPRAWTVHLALFALTALTATIAGAYSWEGLDASALDVLYHPSLLTRGIPYAVLLLTILLAHELGHYVACRRHGIAATLPYFIPGLPFAGTFGAVIRIRSPIPDRNALFDVAAAGPLAGFLICLPVLVAGILRAVAVPGGFPGGSYEFGSPLISTIFERFFHGTADLRVDSVYGAAWIGLLVTSLNLFPVGQLDGGHAVYAVSRRAHRILSRGTVALLVALVLYQTLVARCMPGYLLWVVVLAVMRDRHPRLLDEVTPLTRGRRLFAAILAVLLALTFIPLPIRIPLDWF